MLKNYVGDELQGEGAVHLIPQRPGHSSAGVRINLVDYYKGAIFETRFTRSALGVGDFLNMRALTTTTRAKTRATAKTEADPPPAAKDDN
jgi:hypothetical protein